MWRSIPRNNYTVIRRIASLIFTWWNFYFLTIYNNARYIRYPSNHIPFLFLHAPFFACAAYTIANEVLPHVIHYNCQFGFSFLSREVYTVYRIPFKSWIAAYTSHLSLSRLSSIIMAIRCAVLHVGSMHSSPYTIHPSISGQKIRSDLLCGGVIRKKKKKKGKTLFFGWESLSAAGRERFCLAPSCG